MNPYILLPILAAYYGILFLLLAPKLRKQEKKLEKEVFGKSPIDLPELQKEELQKEETKGELLETDTKSPPETESVNKKKVQPVLMADKPETETSLTSLPHPHEIMSALQRESDKSTEEDMAGLVDLIEQDVSTTTIKKDLLVKGVEGLTGFDRLEEENILQLIGMYTDEKWNQ